MRKGVTERIRVHHRSSYRVFWKRHALVRICIVLAEYHFPGMPVSLFLKLGLPMHACILLAPEPILTHAKLLLSPTSSVSRPEQKNDIGSDAM